MTTRENFKKTVYGYWASRFNCDMDVFSQSKISIFVDDQVKNRNSVNIYQIGKLRIIRISPALEKEFGDPSKFQATGEAFTNEELLTNLLGNKYQVEEKNILLDYFLAPPDFNPQATPDKFALKRLDPDSDTELLSKLFNACTPEELDDADIILDEPDPVILGLIYNRDLAAYASHRYWGDEEIADIGVLIHPDYRGQGLGKGIVSSLCAWCIQHNVVPMYRIFDDSIISEKIPKRLGFGELITVSTYSVKKRD